MIDRLVELAGLWAHYGRALNLLGNLGVDGLLGHLTEGLDAVDVAARLGARGLWVDVGSGAGSPGLVVASARPEAVVLVEPREKRAAFLRLAIGAIKLSHATVIRARIEGSTWSQMSIGEEIAPKKDEIGAIGSKAVMDPERWISVAREIAPRASILCHVADPERLFDGQKPDATAGEARRWVVGFRGPV